MEEQERQIRKEVSERLTARLATIKSLSEELLISEPTLTKIKNQSEKVSLKQVTIVGKLLGLLKK